MRRIVRLLAPLCLILALSACGLTDRGGPWWEPEDHSYQIDPTTNVQAELPAGDYLTVIVPLKRNEPVSEQPDYNPRLMHFAGFRFSPPTKREYDEGKNGQFIFSFITLEAGDSEVVIHRLGPDKKPAPVVYAKLSVKVVNGD